MDKNALSYFIQRPKYPPLLLPLNKKRFLQEKISRKSPTGSKNWNSTSSSSPIHTSTKAIKTHCSVNHFLFVILLLVFTDLRENHGYRYTIWSLRGRLFEVLIFSKHCTIQIWLNSFSGARSGLRSSSNQLRFFRVRRSGFDVAPSFSLFVDSFTWVWHWFVGFVLDSDDVVITTADMSLCRMMFKLLLICIRWRRFSFTSFWWRWILVIFFLTLLLVFSKQFVESLIATSTTNSNISIVI